MEVENDKNEKFVILNILRTFPLWKITRQLKLLNLYKKTVNAKVTFVHYKVSFLDFR